MVSVGVLDFSLAGNYFKDFGSCETEAGSAFNEYLFKGNRLDEISGIVSVLGSRNDNRGPTSSNRDYKIDGIDVKVYYDDSSGMNRTGISIWADNNSRVRVDVASKIQKEWNRINGGLK